MRDLARCLAKLAAQPTLDVAEAMNSLTRAIDTTVKGRNDDIEGEARPWIQVC
jgi:hypothetical protein